MATANGTAVKRFGEVPSTGGLRPSAFMIEGVLMGGEIRPVAQRDGSTKYVHTLRLVLDTGGHARCAVWLDQETDMGELLNQRVQLEILQFRPSQYGMKLHPEATEKYEIEARFPAGVIE